MNLKYLGKIRSGFESLYGEYAQLVNFPNLESRQRCLFCAYYEDYRVNHTFNECSGKHGCLGQSLIFAILKDCQGESWFKAQDFTPTATTKQTAIDNVKRYLRLFSCDLQGYECASVCQYYASRVASEKSIAECASNNACGRNGSFWFLFTLQNKYFNLIPAINNWDFQAHPLIQMDGTILDDIDITQCTITVDNFVYLDDGAGHRYRILNMLKYSDGAGCALYCPYENDPRLWIWESYTNTGGILGTEVIVVNDTDPLYQMLIAAGMPADNIEYPLKNLTQVEISSSLTEYFTTDVYHTSKYNFGDYQIAYFVSRTTGNKYFVRFGVNSGNWLARYVGQGTESEYRRHKLNFSVPTGYRVIDITDYYDDMASFLRKWGVRDSVFYFKEQP